MLIILMEGTSNISVASQNLIAYGNRVSQISSYKYISKKILYNNFTQSSPTFFCWELIVIWLTNQKLNYFLLLSMDLPGLTSRFLQIPSNRLRYLDSKERQFPTQLLVFTFAKSVQFYPKVGESSGAKAPFIWSQVPKTTFLLKVTLCYEAFWELEVATADPSLASPVTASQVTNCIKFELPHLGQASQSFWVASKREKPKSNSSPS